MTNSINYSSAAVRIGRKNLLDEWKDSVRPLETIYYAKVAVKFDSNYIIRVSSINRFLYTTFQSYNIINDVYNKQQSNIFTHCRLLLWIKVQEAQIREKVVLLFSRMQYIIIQTHLSKNQHKKKLFAKIYNQSTRPFYASKYGY